MSEDAFVMAATREVLKWLTRVRVHAADSLLLIMVADSFYKPRISH